MRTTSCGRKVGACTQLFVEWKAFGLTLASANFVLPRVVRVGRMRPCATPPEAFFTTRCNPSVELTSE